MLGVQIAGYTIEAVAGRGGMGVVYRARDRELDRPVAVKVIAPELAQDAGFRTRFEREARVSAQLDHPNVVPVFDAGDDDGRLYIAMRWVEGTDLGRLIAERGPLEPGDAAELVAQAASALDAAHAHGLVHRDVKPANLLIPAAAPWHVYLTDFGLAKRDGSSAGVTGTGEWLGTPDFASPEQVEGQELDARADVYGLGCVLFAALTGRPPFADVPRLRKGWAQANEPPPTLRSIDPALPAALEPVLARALAKEPGERYRSAGELGEAARAAAGSAAPASAATRTLSPPPPATGSAADTAPLARSGARRRRTGAAALTARLARPRPSARRALGLALLTALAGVALAAALGAFAGAPHRIRPLPRAQRPAAPATLPTPSTAMTVRCSASACTQAGRRVQAPIEDGRCGSGSWSRIDAGSPPLIACIPDAAPAARAPAPVPDLAGARLDRAELYLDRLGIGHDTSGGGTFGIVERDNWQVCTTTPAYGATVAPGDGVKLFVDRSC